MRVGIISNSDSFIPLAYTLAAQRLQVYLFHSQSQDPFINLKVRDYLSHSSVISTEEKNKDDLYRWLKANKLDFCFVIGYKYLINLERLVSIETQLFNIHFGLLPSFRGPVPIFWQLKQGVQKLGLCIHRITSKFDEGSIVWYKEFDNQQYYNVQILTQLFNQICVEGALFILQLLSNNLPLPSNKQDEKKACYMKKPTLNDIMIDWKIMDAMQICNLIQACNPWNKGAITIYQNQEVKLMDALIISTDNNTEYQPGTILEIDKNLLIHCSDNKQISVSMVYFLDSYIPAYRLSIFGFKSLDKFA
jgi:methionyl-tRNA formyltransferase